MSAKLYELLGRKQEALENLDANYTQLLNLVAGILDGSIDRERVMVNLTERTCAVVPIGEVAFMPATMNGLPRCVISKRVEPGISIPEAIAERANGVQP